MGRCSASCCPRGRRWTRSHGKVLALGGSCDGKPGFRGPEEMGLYFTYVRDLDGNKLCAYRIGQA